MRLLVALVAGLILAVTATAPVDAAPPPVHHKHGDGFCC